MTPLKKALLLIVIIAGAVGILYFWEAPQTKAPERDPSMGLEVEDKYASVTTSTVQYHDTASGYLVVPDGEGPFPALILIHEWWGLNDNIRDYAERFAKQGYVALAVDLYDGESTETADQARVLATSVRENMDSAFANLQSAVDYLNGLDVVQEDSLASVGWCFGGGWSYEMAKNDLDVQSSVIYYGRFNPDDDLSMMRADILGHFGEEDASIAVDDVKAFEAKLQTLQGEHQIFIYENAGHAFANEDNEDAYDRVSADQAWIRTIEFLQRQFGE